MNQKTAFSIAAALTAFVLVIGGAIAGRMTQPAAASATPTTAEMQALLTQREAEYQARLNEANQALAAAYAAQSAPAPVLAAAPAFADQQPTAPLAALTPQDALNMALAVMPNGVSLRTPELVDFQGALAYEVSFSQGLVYIDANTGSLLYNGAAQTTAQNPGGFEQEHGHDDDHEGQDHD